MRLLHKLAFAHMFASVAICSMNTGDGGDDSTQTGAGDGAVDPEPNTTDDDSTDQGGEPGTTNDDVDNGAAESESDGA